MDELTNFKQHIFEKILTDFPHCMIDEKKSNNSNVVLRLPIVNKEAAEEFKTFLSNITNSAWIVYCSKQKSNEQTIERVVFSKTWLCQHSKKNKGHKTRRNAECSAKLKIKIKKINKNTCRRDRFLTMNPPLTGEVNLCFKHEHNTKAAAALKMLRISNEVKESFNEYFSNGLGPTEAMRYHENAFLYNNDYAAVGNSALNPTRRQVAHLHAAWTKKNFGSFINPLDMLKNKLEIYKSKGATVKISNVESWSVVVVTPVMKRLHSIEKSKEMIFVDSTSSCEATGTSITILLASSKVGALPLAVLIHPAQTKESYENAFNLLTESFPFCFGGQNVILSCKLF